MQPTAALQAKLYDEMLSRIQQTDANVPARERGFYYYSRTVEGKQYPIHARKKGSLDAPEQVILDVNALAEGKKFMSVAAMQTSPDGNFLAYTSDDVGFRQYRLHVKDLRNGKELADTAERVTTIEWTEDGKSLLYSQEHKQTKRSDRVLRHVMGLAGDELLYEERDERFNVGVDKSRDHKYFFVTSASHTTSEVRYLPADTGTAPLRVVAERIPDQEYYVDHRNGVFWIRTNDRGRNFRLVTAPARDPARASWKEAVPHRDDVMLSNLVVFRDFYVTMEREGGWPQVGITELRTGKSHRVAFPEPAYQVFLSGNREFDAPFVRIAYQSADHLVLDLRLRAHVPQADAAQAGCSAWWLRPVTLPGRSDRGGGERRDAGADVGALTQGPQARRYCPGTPIRLRFVRVVEQRVVQHQRLQPRGSRRRLRRGLHPRRRRARQEVARPGPHVREEEHLHGLHRGRGASHRAEVRRPRPDRDHGRQRRGTPHGRSDQHASRALSRRDVLRPVRGRHHDDAGRDAPAHGGRVRGMG
jgi:hypothetical protein